MFKFAVDPNEPLPLYAQLERAIKVAIASGQLPIGGQLPTVRQLAVELRINANTVARVYSELERQGVLETKRGIGTFVLSQPQQDGNRSLRERNRRLRTLVDRFLEEGVASGYSLQELRDAINVKLKQS